MVRKSVLKVSHVYTTCVAGGAAKKRLPGSYSAAEIKSASRRRADATDTPDLLNVNVEFARVRDGQSVMVCVALISWRRELTVGFIGVCQAAMYG